MPLFLLTWLKKFSLRQYAEAGAAVALVLFILYWDHLKIQEGRDEVRAEDAKALSDTKAQLAKLQDEKNPLNIQRKEIQNEITNLVEPIKVDSPDYPAVDLVRLRAERAGNQKR